MVAISRALSLACLATSTVLARRLSAVDVATRADAGQAAAEETSSAAQAEIDAFHTWVSNEQVWCISGATTLECDEDSIMNVRTAMYNRNPMDRKTGEKCEPSALGKKSSCSVKNTDSIRALCDGRQRCTIPADAHSACQETPFTFMRVKFECVTGKPRNPDDVQPLSESPDVIAKPDVVDAVIESSSKQESGSKEVRKAPVVKAPVRIQPVKPKRVSSVDFRKPVEIKKIKGAKVVKKQVDQDLAKQQVVTTVLVPCWRTTRWDLVSGGHPFDRLTTCGEYEGCFRVRHSSGVVFDNEDVPPTKKEILESDIVEGEDSVFVVLDGMKLKRNKHHTWGVCLPKTGGLEYAMQMFSSLKVLIQK